MTMTQRMWSIGIAATLALGPASVAMAQSASPTPAVTKQQAPPPGRAGRAAGPRGNPPPVSPNMSPAQLQALLDGYAVVQAQKQLKLTDEQYPNFVAKLTKLQDVRRRHQIDRRRLMGELSGLLQAAEGGQDDAIGVRVKALDDLNQRIIGEVRQAYQDIDAVLTPWQRGRFRMFEEQLERQKVEMLSKINANPERGGGK